ncbi:MAG: hypothetical protein ACREJU_12340 [Nitrospiraceae bacterium]
MRDMRFITGAWLVSLLALIVCLLSLPVQADDQSMGTNIPSERQDIQKEMTQTDGTRHTTIPEEQDQITRETPVGELGKKNERLMNVPQSNGPTLLDMEMTREQEEKAALSF